MTNLLLVFIFFYCSVSPMEYNVIKNKNIQNLIVNYCIAEFNKRTNKNDVFDRMYNNRTIEPTSLWHICTKIYQACYPSIYNSSLQKINIDALQDMQDEKNWYLHNPLAHGVDVTDNYVFKPNAFSYNSFNLAKRKNTIFLFNDIFDGPTKENQWIFSYNTANPESNIQKSFFIIVKLKDSSTNNQIITSKILEGNISAVTLSNANNEAYITTSKIDTETNTPTIMLHWIVFSMLYPQISFTSYSLPGISSVKKLLPLTKSLLFILCNDGVLHKIDIHNRNASIIDILDIENKKIKLENIIANPTIPYLWLLTSKASALYLLNLKNKNQKITFSKITNQFTAKNIWFDSDYILAEDNAITMPIERPIEKAIPIQYSLYELCMIPSKTTFSELSMDNNNAK